MVGSEEEAVQVYGQYSPPQVEVHLRDAGAFDEAPNIVDQNVDATELVTDVVHGSRHLGATRSIESDRVRSLPVLRGQLVDECGIWLVGSVGHGHLCAVSR